jgi:RimJ/RimL family protein N-acetyltransferase
MVTIRRAQSTDAEMVFGWRNDDEARAVSRSSKKVEWDEHAHWFAERLMTKHAESVWIIERGETPVGSGRINKYKDDHRAEISIALAPKHRREGLGRVAISQLSTMAKSMGRVPVAYVRVSNRRSLNAFMAAGFKPVDSLSDGMAVVSSDPMVQLHDV